MELVNRNEVVRDVKAYMRTAKAMPGFSHRCLDCGRGTKLVIIHGQYFCTDCAEAIEIEMAAVTVLHSVEHLRDLKAKARERADEQSIGR